MTDHIARWTNERKPSLCARIREVGVLREKSIARMNAVAAGRLGDGQNRVLIQIALCRRRGADAHGARRKLHMQRLGVRFGVHRHGLHAKLPAGAQNPQRDFTPVGDQHTLQHGLYLKSGSP